jgi:hypothetical protein
MVHSKQNRINRRYNDTVMRLCKKVAISKDRNERIIYATQIFDLTIKNKHLLKKFTYYTLLTIDKLKMLKLDEFPNADRYIQKITDIQNEGTNSINDECCVCMEEIESNDKFTLKCNHSYCANCIFASCNSVGHFCPLCRTEIQ